MEIIKVSSKSISSKVAGSISNIFKKGEKKVEVETIGAGAVNQAIKSIAIARGFVAPLGINIICTPAFTDVNIDGNKKTGIKLIVETR